MNTYLDSNWLKPQFTVNIKGRTINIPKIDLINRIILDIDSTMKTNDFVLKSKTSNIVGISFKSTSESFL